MFNQDLGCGVPGNLLSIAVDATGAAHIAYAGMYPDYGLKYATNQGGASITYVIDIGYIPKLSAAVDANGKTHVAYSVTPMTSSTLIRMLGARGASKSWTAIRGVIRLSRWTHQAMCTSATYLH